MEKEQNQESDKINDLDGKEQSVNSENENQVSIEEVKKDESTTEEKILELEDKLARTFAEMENQRRRFEKEREEAYEYGGFSFAKEALNLIDNSSSILAILFGKSFSKPCIVASSASFNKSPALLLSKSFSVLIFGVFFGFGFTS